MKREKTTARVSSKRPEEEVVSMLHQKKNARLRNTEHIGDNIIFIPFLDYIFPFLFDTQTAFV